MSKKLFWYDHFLGDSLDVRWNVVVAGGAGSTVVVVDQQTGGIARMTTNPTNGSQARIDWNNIRSLLVSKLVMQETRVKLNNITDIAVNLNTLLYDGINFMRIVLNTATSGDLYLQSYFGVGSTSVSTGIAADTSYHICQIQTHTLGGNHIHFFMDGVELPNSPITTNVATTYLQPYIGLNTLANATKSEDLDYCMIVQDR